jgi:hypothetical protein
LVGNAPEGVAQLFLVYFSHDCIGPFAQKRFAQTSAVPEDF